MLHGNDSEYLHLMHNIFLSMNNETEEYEIKLFLRLIIGYKKFNYAQYIKYYIGSAI